MDNNEFARLLREVSDGLKGNGGKGGNSGGTHGTHRQSRTKTYKCWCDMKQRCYSPNHDGYRRYGGRGIAVCERWLSSFEHFLADMGECPANHSLDRINNDGNYVPNNCRWATPRQQGLNRSNNRRLTYKGVTRTLTEWSAITGLGIECLWLRLNRRGWSVEKAIETPNRNGQFNSLSDADIEAICRSNHPIYSLARRYKIDEKSIQKIRSKHSWKFRGGV